METGHSLDTRVSRRGWLETTGALAGGLIVARLCPAARPGARQDGFLVHSDVPRNAEPPLDALVESWLTPNERFFIRSHAPVPQVDPGMELSVEGLVQRPFHITVEQLREQFDRVTAAATLTCAGNRRSEHSRVKEVAGVQWQAGAIGNARWGGARLSDLLRKAGVMPAGTHVWFEGVDEVERPEGVIPFGASIPIAKAMGDTTTMPGALVAYEMNDRPLEPDHGFPLRTVVPGFIGARSVKWLGKIIVSDRPSSNYFVSGAYKLVQQGTPDEWAGQEPIYHFPINAVTCRPSAGARVGPGAHAVHGFALPSGAGARTIARVELSSDEGRTWHAAALHSQNQPYCWRLWSAEIPIPASATSIAVRATDSAGETQPETVPWNLKGYLYNAWHRIPVTS